jgi:hypothetical protein
MRKAIVGAVMIAARAGATFGMSTLSLSATMGSCSARMKLQEPDLGADDLLFGGHGVLPFAEARGPEHHMSD